MPSKILELRRKVSGSFNHNDSLSYVRTNWSGIDGRPSVYPPAGHTHPIAQVDGLPGVLEGKVEYKGLLGTTDLNTLNNEAAQGIYSQNSNANATLARNYPTASSGAGLLRVYWTGANSGVVQEYNNYINGRIYVRAYQGSSWSGWSTIADRDWVTSNTRSNTWVPSWSEVTSKPSWIGSSKPSYNLGEIAETSIYKLVTDLDKIAWNGKQASITGAATTIALNDLTTNRALISNGSGKVAVSAVTATELGYLDGVTSNIQTQLNGKLSTGGGTLTGALTSNASILMPFRGTAGTDRIYQEFQGVSANDATNQDSGAFIRFRTSTSAGYGADIGAYRRAGGTSALIIKTGGQNPTESVRIDENKNLIVQGTITSSGQSVVLNNDSRLTDSRPASDVQSWAKSSQPNASNRFLTVNNNTASWRTATQMRSDLGLGTLATSNSLSLNDLSDISASSPSNGQILTYTSTGWVNANKPSYDLGEIADTAAYTRVSAFDRGNWNGKQDSIGYTPENAANKRTSIRNSGANDTSYVSELGIKNYVDANAVPTSRTIAGHNLTADISRDNLLGTSSAGYVRRTAIANTYDIRTVANMRSDLSINNVTNESKATMFTSPTFTGTTTAAAINVNGAVGLRASALGSAATQILVVSANPASTTRTVQTRTPAQIKSDIGVPTNILRQVSFSGGTLIVEVV